MDKLNWLANRRFLQATRYEFAWDFIFDGDVGIDAECLWRLIEDGRIRVTRNDDSHKFGLPRPVACLAQLNQTLADAETIDIKLHQGRLDLEIRFSTGHLLQLIPDSSGYESWQARHASKYFVAVGGGTLAVYW